MAELVDALDLGSSVLRRVGSSPVVRTKPVRILTGFFCFVGDKFKDSVSFRYDGGRLSMNKK